MNIKDLVKKKEALIQTLINEGYLKTEKIVDAFRNVPRHLFVPESVRKYAYLDKPLPIGFAQTISAPHMNAMCTELLKLKKTDKVLEIGSGSGYQAELLSVLCKKVITIELEKELADFAKSNLERAGIKNVEVLNSDGSKGFPGLYDKILITCACKEIPNILIKQLKMGGIIVAPVGDLNQVLVLGIKTDKGLERKEICGCVFVPLRH